MPRTVTAEAARANAARPIFFNFIRFLRPDAREMLRGCQNSLNGKSGWGPASIVKGKCTLGLLRVRNPATAPFRCLVLTAAAGSRQQYNRQAGGPTSPTCL